MISLVSAVVSSMAASAALGAGLDVQLKDLRGAFYYTQADLATLKECTKLSGPEIKKFGRLTHCKPEEKYVECHPTTGQTLFVFEQESACEASLKSGKTPTPDET